MAQLMVSYISEYEHRSKDSFVPNRKENKAIERKNFLGHKKETCSHHKI